MPLQRYRVSLANWPGAPGVMTFYLGSGVTDFTPIRTFCNSLTGVMPNGLSFSFPTTVDVFNEANGQLTGSLPATTLATVSSSVTAAAYSGTSGALVRWNTGLIQAGKRVAGRTYVVPLAGSNYDTNGSLSTTCIGLIQGAANTLLTSLTDGLKVWSRPVTADATKTPPVVGRAGAIATVISAAVPDLAVVMRSRRV